MLDAAALKAKTEDRKNALAVWADSLEEAKNPIHLTVRWMADNDRFPKIEKYQNGFCYRWLLRTNEFSFGKVNPQFKTKAGKLAVLPDFFTRYVGVLQPFKTRLDAFHKAVEALHKELMAVWRMSLPLNARRALGVLQTVTRHDGSLAEF